jgi:hypothetical protein
MLWLMLADWFVAISRTGVIDLAFRPKKFAEPWSLPVATTFLKVVLLLGGVVVNSRPLDSHVPLGHFPTNLCSCEDNGGGVEVCWIKYFWRFIV